MRGPEVVFTQRIRDYPGLPSTMATTATAISMDGPPSHPAHSMLLARAHSPDTAARIFTDKVKNKPLLVQPTAVTDKRALRRHVRLRKKEYYLRKRKPRPLSAKEKRELGMLRLDKAEIRYDTYKGLYEMWNAYMLEVLGYTTTEKNDGRGKMTDNSSSSNNEKKVSAQSHGSLLASADFHGAEIQVVRCPDPGKVGIKGIVVRDTKFTFVVVTAGNKVKTLPKKDTVFRYEILLPGHQDDDNDATTSQQKQTSGRLVFEIHGSQFEFRPAERANRKFKWRPMDYL